MGRRLFMLMSVLSAVLFTATCVLWVRTRGSRYDTAEYQADRKQYSLTSVFGDLCICVQDQPVSKYAPAGFKYAFGCESVAGSWDEFWYRPSYAKRFIVFGWVESGYYRVLILPYWVLATCLFVLPSLWVAGQARRRCRTGESRCPACGYDLRATPDRCPECGTVPATGTQ